MVRNYRGGTTGIRIKRKSAAIKTNKVTIDSPLSTPDRSLAIGMATAIALNQPAEYNPSSKNIG